MKVFYRISDKGNPKEKIPSADKFGCLQNAIREFGKDEIYVIADNCSSKTLDHLEEIGIRFEVTTLGNSGSFVYVARLIVNTVQEDELVYLLEDDYIHLPGASKLLQEGLTLADYVTLYDHPDKYIAFNEHGNPFNFNRLHPTRLMVTKNSHWATINSTTMTFACRVKTLKEDLPIWEKYTESRNPKDFHAFVELSQNGIIDAFSFLFLQKKKLFFKLIMKNRLCGKKMRKIISSIPARATHAEVKWLAPVIDWDSI